MADISRTEASYLVSNACEYDFFQLLHLIEAQLVKNKSFHQTIKLSATKYLCFPAADIQSIILQESSQLELQLNFSGFTGVDSPLPHYFFVELAKNNHDCLQNFLAIFNQRLYFLFYAAWKKYHPEIMSEASYYLNILQHISGNSLLAADQNEFAYCSLFASKTRPVVSLTQMLAAWLQVPVQIKQFVLQKIPLEIFTLGKSHIALGDNALIGSYALSSNKLQIYIDAFSAKQFLTYLPPHPLWQRLNQLIQRFIPPFTQYELILQLQANSICILGKIDVYLGWSVWLGKPNTRLQSRLNVPKFN